MTGNKKPSRRSRERGKSGLLPSAWLTVLPAVLLLAGCTVGGIDRPGGEQDHLSDEYYQERHERVVNEFLDNQPPSNYERMLYQMNINAVRREAWLAVERRSANARRLQAMEREEQKRIFLLEFDSMMKRSQGSY